MPLGATLAVVPGAAFGSGVVGVAQPTVKAKIETNGFYFGPEVVLTFNGDSATSDECKATVIVRSSSGGMKNQKNFSINWCAYEGKAKGTTWEFESPLFQDFRFMPEADVESPKETIRISVLSHGRVLVTRNLVIARYHKPDYQIWQGTDEFVNYCIDSAIKLYSESGRLYCWHIGGRHMSIRGV